MTGRPINPDDPTFRPLTLSQVLEITGRKRRTIERWVTAEKLTRYEVEHRRKVVAVFNEDEVLEAEKQMREAAEENRERIRRRGGRPGPRDPKPPESDAT